jgi:FKBP-type peptidyl-prolyl cis-trans isomerase
MLIQSRANELMEKVNAAGKTFLETAKAEKGAVATKGGVVVVPLYKGVGQYPTSASSVKVHYTGMLADGTVFDSSVQRGEPATFALKQVIKGWQEGLQEMQEGGKARLVVPSDMGYGPQGQPQAGIPGGAVLVFEVELIKVLSGGVGGLIL